MDALQKNRLRWNCRRGLLELDLILERFLQHNEGDERLVELLELPDNDLLDIVMARSDRFEPHLAEIVARLRTA